MSLHLLHGLPCNGYDASHWNGPPDMAALAELDWLEMLGAKAAHVGGAKMVDNIDPMFARNRKVGSELDIRWRPFYLFLHGSVSVHVQIEALTRAVGDLAVGESVYLDWEVPAASSGQLVAPRTVFDEAGVLLDLIYPGRWFSYVNDVNAEMTAWLQEQAAEGGNRRPAMHPAYNVNTGFAEARKWKATIWQTGPLPGVTFPVAGYPEASAIPTDFVLRPDVMDRLCGRAA